MEKRYAVVTGATQGIGRAVAERLLSEGFSIAICARTESDLIDLKTEWQQQFPAAEAYCLQADFAKPEAVLAFADQVLNLFPQINILVNNAGIFQGGDIATEPTGQLEEMMQVNLFAAYHLTRSLLPRMKAGSHIFNLCSVASLKAYPNGGSYSITKYALLGFSENLRYELMPQKIRVTALCPGATWSRSWSGSGIEQARVMEATDVSEMLWSAYKLSAKADVELIVMRPIEGDL